MNEADFDFLKRQTDVETKIKGVALVETDLYQLQSEIEGLSIDNALLRAENIRLRWENKPKIEATAAGVETTEQEVARLRTTTQRLRDELLFVDLAFTRLKEDIKAVGLDTESIRKVAAAIRGQMV